MITSHKRRLPLISSIIRYRKCPFNILCVLFQISVEVQQFFKEAARGIAAELSLKCTNASCSRSILLVHRRSSVSDITPCASVSKTEQASEARKYQPCFPSNPPPCSTPWYSRSAEGKARRRGDLLFWDPEGLFISEVTQWHGSSSME